MRALLRFAIWATLAFVLAWFVAHPYQRVLAGLASRVVAPPGSQIEWLDLEIFFPYDLSVFAALCLASAWVPWPMRLRALALGGAVLIAVELLTLIAVMKSLLATAGQPPEQAEATQRFVVGVIRVTGLVAAGCAWTYLLGWQRMPQLAEGLAARNAAARGGKR